jgi:hypothetical protein
MRRGILALGATVTTIALVGVALARTPVALEDPNDTAGLMDVLIVTFDAAEAPTWAVALQRPWRPVTTWDRAFVFVYVDVVGDQRGDYYAIVRPTGDELSGSLWRDPRRGNDVKVRPLEVLWRSSKEIAISIPLASMDVGRFRSVYRWWVVTTFSGEVCRRTCIDRAPDEGSVEQLLPGATPTPTPSPSPNPSPTVTPTPTPSPT